ncbi:MAG: hypothetical protein IKX32_02010, partial [Bacteroidales bacterium]|nr:hypothetical protein [Bacteroidales bacterium]
TTGEEWQFKGSSTLFSVEIPLNYRSTTVEMSEQKGCLPNHYHLAGGQCAHLDQVDAICGNPKFPL